MKNKKGNKYIRITVLLIVLLIQSLTIQAEDNKYKWSSSISIHGGWERLLVNPSNEYILGKGVYLKELVRGSNWDGSLDAFGLSVGIIPVNNHKLYAGMGFYYFGKNQIEYTNYGETITYDISGECYSINLSYVLFKNIIAPYIGAGFNLLNASGSRGEITAFTNTYIGISIKAGVLIKITRNIRLELNYSPVTLGAGFKGPELTINASLWFFPELSIPDNIEESTETSISPISEE